MFEVKIISAQKNITQVVDCIMRSFKKDYKFVEKFTKPGFIFHEPGDLMDLKEIVFGCRYIDVSPKTIDDIVAADAIFALAQNKTNDKKFKFIADTTKIIISDLCKPVGEFIESMDRKICGIDKEIYETYEKSEDTEDFMKKIIILLLTNKSINYFGLEKIFYDVDRVKDGKQYKRYIDVVKLLIEPANFSGLCLAKN